MFIHLLFSYDGVFIFQTVVVSAVKTGTEKEKTMGEVGDWFRSGVSDSRWVGILEGALSYGAYRSEEWHFFESGEFASGGQQEAFR